MGLLLGGNHLRLLPPRGAAARSATTCSASRRPLAPSGEAQQRPNHNDNDNYPRLCFAFPVFRSPCFFLLLGRTPRSWRMYAHTLTYHTAPLVLRLPRAPQITVRGGGCQLAPLRVVCAGGRRPAPRPRWWAGAAAVFCFSLPVPCDVCPSSTHFVCWPARGGGAPPLSLVLQLPSLSLSLFLFPVLPTNVASLP